VSEQALEVIDLARDGLNPDLQGSAVFFNIADMRRCTRAKPSSRCAKHVGDKLLDTTIRQSIAYAGSPSVLSRSSITAPISPRTTTRWAPSCCAAWTGPRPGPRSRCCLVQFGDAGAL